MELQVIEKNEQLAQNMEHEILPGAPTGQNAATIWPVHFKPADILTGGNLLPNFYDNKQNVSLQQMIQVAKELEEKSGERSYAKSDVILKVEHGRKGEMTDVLICDNQEYRLSPFAHRQLLEVLDVPYGWYEKQDENIRQFLLGAKLKPAMPLTLRYVEVDGVRVARGLVTSNRLPMKNLNLLQELADYVDTRGCNVEILRPFMSADMMNFKLVIDDFERVLPNNDKYRRAVDFSNSDIGFIKTTMAPAWVCVRCLNGLVDVKAQEQIINLKNINVPQDAIRIMLNGTFNWFNQSGGSNILDSFEAMIREEKRLNKSKAEKVLKEALAKVPTEYSKGIESFVWEKHLPDGMAEDFSANAYDFINDVTEKAQALPPRYTQQIEVNVAEWLQSKAAAKL